MGERQRESLESPALLLDHSKTLSLHLWVSSLPLSTVPVMVSFGYIKENSL